MKINEVVTEGVWDNLKTAGQKIKQGAGTVARGLGKVAAITPGAVAKGLAKSIAPNTVADWDKLKNPYANPNMTPPPIGKTQPKTPLEVTTPENIKVKKDPANGKWIRQDNNQIVSDPREIGRLEQLAKNARQVAIARGTQTR